VFVACSHVGLGTGTVAVTDARTRESLRLDGARVTLVGGVVCVRAASQGVEDGLHRVTLPGGAAAWVRVVGPAARGTAA
jgi:hypothetical protein